MATAAPTTGFKMSSVSTLYLQLPISSYFRGIVAQCSIQESDAFAPSRMTFDPYPAATGFRFMLEPRASVNATQNMSSALTAWSAATRVPNWMRAA